jgi:uncharacterized protein YjiK
LLLPFSMIFNPHLGIPLIYLILFSLMIACADPVSGPGSSHPDNTETKEYTDDNDQEEGSDSDGSGDSPAEPAFQQRDVIISEVMVRQQETLADPDFNAYSGWIELHNRENNPVDISGWVVGFRPASYSTAVEYSVQDLRFHVVPPGTTIPSQGFFLLWASGQDHAGEAIHLDFVLPVEGGKVGLYGPEASGTPVVDTLSYRASDVAHDISLGRMDFGWGHRGFLVPMNEPTPGEANRLATLTLIESHSLNVGDPSGLAPDHTGRYLWSVSDNPGGSIYKLDLQGNIVDELPVSGDDMEGIAQHPRNRSLYVVEERLRQVVQFDTLGNEIARYQVDVEVRNQNDGLEGITIDPVTNRVFVVNEKNPRVLIELDLLRGFDRQEIRRSHMDFGAPEDVRGLDLSGLFYDEADGLLWLVSDEARAVFVLDRTGRPLAAFDAGQPDLEGIAIIRSNSRIYLVSDELQTLFVYEYPDPLVRLPVPD